MLVVVVVVLGPPPPPPLGVLFNLAWALAALFIALAAFMALFSKFMYPLAAAFAALLICCVLETRFFALVAELPSCCDKFCACCCERPISLDTNFCSSAICAVNTFDLY